jgi:hypothetical protein
MPQDQFTPHMHASLSSRMTSMSARVVAPSSRGASRRS